MAMNKKEQEYVESLKTELAFRRTLLVEPDLDIPESWNEIVNGYSFNAYSIKVEKSCSSGGYHNLWGWDKTTSHKGIRQYSTRLLALKAMRYEVEKDCAKKLRNIDKLIEAEEQSAQDARS
jgi:hypothetical protein